MDLGTGILFATILAIAAWQIDKRGAWKKTGKTALWIFAAVVVVTGAIFGFAAAEDWWRDRRQARQWATEREQLRGTGITTYIEVRLGMSPNEVLYVLGEPSSRHPESDDESAYWAYDSPSRAVVWERGGNKVRGMYCLESAACPALVGVQIEDDETELRSKLGPPLSPDVLPSDAGYLTLDYGSQSGAVRFRLYRRQVRQMGVVRLPTPEEVASDKAASDARGVMPIDPKEVVWDDSPAIDAAEAAEFAKRREAELRAGKKQQASAGRFVPDTDSRWEVVSEEPARHQTGPMPLPEPRWHDRSAWTQVKEGMRKVQVLGILGKPTSTQTIGAAEILFYRSEVPFRSGNVKLLDDRVWQINTPAF